MNKTVIVIIADQLRADCFGKNKRLPVITPNIDSLMNDSAVFNHAYTQSPVCAPARSALFTGQIPERTGTVLNGGILPVNGVSPECLNTARAFSQNSWQTRHYGKWNLDGRLTPADYGYDYYLPQGEYPYNSARRRTQPDDRKFFLTPYITPDETVTYSDWVTDRLTADIEQSEDDIFVQVEYPEPHVPYTPKKKYYDLYNNIEVFRYPSFDNEKFTDKPYIQRQQILSWNTEDYTFEDFETLLRYYYGFVSELDSFVGKITDSLKRSGRYENSIIVFLADHGDICGAHRMYDKHYIMYDDVMRIPYCIKAPGVRHTENDGLVNGSLDTLPTLIDLAGLKTAGTQFDGISLADSMKNVGDNGRKFVTASYNGAQFAAYTQRMITDGRIKYIWNASDVDELYNLEEDEWECDNLVHCPGYSAVLARMRKELYNIMSDKGDGLCCNGWTKYHLLENKKL